ncbi:MAG TPA: tetratricopeptide repeat protein [Burkholderiales bacterium]|jgi:tetratricopeptide (TPR) repeat protein
MLVPALRLTGLFGIVAALLLGAVPAAAQSTALQEANAAFKQGQYDRALDRVEAHLKSNPKDARGRFLKGLIFAEQRKPNDAIKVFTELTQEFPELPEPYNNLAVLYASQGQYDKARTALEMAIRTHPSYATAHENLGDIYAKMASQAYDKALQLDKGNAPLQTKLNLIKDLFVGAEAPPKPGAAKPEATRVAVATPAQKPPAPVQQTQAKAPAAAAKPVAAKPAPAKLPAKPSSNPDDVLSAVNLWARAWSENDVPAYLAHYATDFKTPNGEPRASWEAQRKARIAKPRKIQVEVEAPKVVFNESGRVTVTFRQHYRSDTLNVSSTKILVMVRSGDKWLIQQERVGS